MKNNLLSGLTVGIIALPLSMALAIAKSSSTTWTLDHSNNSWNIWQQFFGSSKINISGPTAGFLLF